MIAQTPRELSPAEAGFLPLTPEIKIVCLACLQAVSQDLEGGAATPTLLGVAGSDLPSKLREVLSKVVCPKGRHPHIDTAAVLPRGEPLALQHPAPPLPHPVTDVLGQL